MSVRMRRTVIITVTALAIAGWLVVFDLMWKPANAACVNDDGSACTSSQMATGFKQGDLHNSQDRVLTLGIQNKIRRWYANHPTASGMPIGDGTSWWEAPFKQTICMMWGGSRGTCIREHAQDDAKMIRFDEQVRIIGEETTRVTVKCGGAAIIGAMGGRLDSGKVGWWGAGAGAGSCLYQTLGSKMGWW